MKSNLLKHFLTTAVFMLLVNLNLNAQSGEPRQSPKITASGKIANAKVTITYGSPSVKGRKIWGDLVPYDKVWRAGANEATQLETDKALIIEGRKLPAGKYSIYIVPGETEFQIILNSETGQWGIKESGETTRDAAKDVLVVSVKPKKSSTIQERLVFMITNKGITFKWAEVEVPISVS